mmetsp:Transcript_21176/g.54679  ORF Transcript_21176/g.54679 Transcript_21176/m.54679 type:complete len:177 (-) Transcript_21176:48-578(-)
MAFGIAMLPGWDFVEFLLWFIENLPRVVAVNVIAVFAAKPGKARWLCILFIPILIVTMISGVILGSWEDAARRGYDPALPSVREAIEVYVAEGTSKGGPDLETILESGNYAPTFGMEEVRSVGLAKPKHTTRPNAPPHRSAPPPTTPPPHRPTAVRPCGCTAIITIVISPLPPPPS